MNTLGLIRYPRRLPLVEQVEYAGIGFSEFSFGFSLLAWLSLEVVTCNSGAIMRCLTWDAQAKR